MTNVSKEFCPNPFLMFLYPADRKRNEVKIQPASDSTKESIVKRADQLKSGGETCQRVIKIQRTGRPDTFVINT